MKRLFRLCGFFFLGLMVGRQGLHHKQEQTTNKIVHAAYLDDRTKILLLQDLEGNKAAKKQTIIKDGATSRQKRQRVKTKLLHTWQQTERLVKPLLSLKK